MRLRFLKSGHTSSDLDTCTKTLCVFSGIARFLPHNATGTIESGNGIYSIAKTEDALNYARQSPDNNGLHMEPRAARFSMFSLFAAAR